MMVGLGGLEPPTSPLSGNVVRSYKNLQDCGDSRSTCKSHKASQIVGWIVGWKFRYPRALETESSHAAAQECDLRNMFAAYPWVRQITIVSRGVRESTVSRS